jgi:hypothetical protein
LFYQVLEKAETDTEKFAALFLVPKLVKSADCDKNARMHLVEAMGYSFLGGYPVQKLFVSEALGYYTSF